MVLRNIPQNTAEFVELLVRQKFIRIAADFDLAMDAKFASHTHAVSI
jgi:hypothetical protein